MIDATAPTRQLARWAAPAAALLWAGCAAAAPIVDQSTLMLAYPEDATVMANTVSRGLSTSTNRIQSQDVTAGLAGRVARVDLQIMRYVGTTEATPLTLSIYEGGRINPQSRLIGSVAISGSSVPQPHEFSSQRFVSFDVGGLMFDVDVGDVFSLQLSTSQPGATFGFVYGWDKDLFDNDEDPQSFSFIHYAHGTNYTSNDGGATLAPTLYDRGFRTFVDATPVSEPATFALLGLGLVGLAVGRRKVGGSRASYGDYPRGTRR